MCALYALAEKLLGQDFISPEEVATTRGLAYTHDQLNELGKKLPDQATLEAIRSARMMLVAGPPMAMSFFNVRDLNPDYFDLSGLKGGQLAWYDDPREEFARGDQITALCWIALRKEPVAGSLFKNWSKQKDMVKVPLYVPNITEVVWVLTSCRAVRDICLFSNHYIRTFTVDADGERVYVGHYDSGGLRVNVYSDDSRFSFLGVSAARKF